MTTIYIPQRIETAEQAEALPLGTVARSDAFAPEVFVKDEDSWMGTHGPGAFTNESAVGLEALVPIEADEHEDEEYGILSDRYSPPDVIPAVGWQTLTPADRQYRRTVYTTPWEEA